MIGSIIKMNKRKIGVVYMSQELYQSIPLLFKLVKKQTELKNAAFAFQNKRGAVKFFFLIERDEQQDLRLLFFKNEEELVRYRLSERLVTMSDEVVGEERTEAFWFRKGIEIQFSKRADFDEEEIEYLKQKGYPVKGARELPMISSFNEPFDLFADLKKSEIQFVLRVSDVLLQEGNWKELLKAASILDQEDADCYAVLEYNQKTKAVKSLNMTRKEISFDQIAELKPFFQVKPEPVAVSDFSLLRAKKAIQGILPETFEIQLTLSPIAAMGFYKTGAFMLAIADEREIIFLQETDLDTKDIQNYILEVIMMMEAVPLRFITSGPFAMRLSNMVDQLLKRLGTDIVILDELPTMNRYSSLAKMDLLLSQNDIDNLLF